MNGPPGGSEADPSGSLNIFWALIRGYFSVWVVMIPVLFIGFGSQMAAMGAWWVTGRVLEGSFLPAGPFYALIALTGLLWVFWMMIRLIGPIMQELQHFILPPSNLVRLGPSLAISILKRHLAALRPSIAAVRALQEDLRRE